MKSVNIAELKNRLSHYLRMVRKGESLLVRDRDVVIARIEPAGARDELPEDDEGRLADLEARGIITRAKKRITKEWLEQLDKNRPECTGDAVAIILEEREQGW